MQVRVMREGLPPRVQDGDHAGLGAEVLRVGTDGADRLGRGLEQDVVDDRLVLQGDGGDGRRHGENDMEIRNWQEFGTTIGEPLGARQALALGAVPIAARVVGDAGLAAVLALLDMAAERCGAAGLHGGHDTALGLRQTTALRGAESLSVAAEDVRHLQRLAHRADYSAGITVSERRSNGLGVPAIRFVATCA